MANEKISDLNIQNLPSNFATLVGVDNGETVQIPINTFAKPSDIPSISGGGASIIYATEKPSTPQQAIYVVTQDEVVKVEFTTYGMILPAEQAYCEIVDTLPEVGNGAMDLTTEALYTYYLTTDGELYGYVDAALEAAGGVPVGWYPVAPLFGAVGTTYGGTITSMSEVTDASAMYALITTEPKTRVYIPTLDGSLKKVITEDDFNFDETTGTLVLDL